ncbi:magnesium transporter CorA family protein [Candidatus Uhrbacteria bacterium]|nr:magnesium transporter CorA family protein [Candidatus Uhrbacteria bacterium]
MVSIYYRNIKESTLKKLDEFKVGSWISVQSPTEEEIAELVEKHALNDGLLRDALDFYEVPRVEVDGNVTYVFLRYPYTEEERIFTAPALIAIGEDFFLTVSAQPFPIEEKFVNGEVDFFTTQKTKFFLQFFFQINTSYTALLNSISRRIRAMGIKLERIENRDIMQLVAFENILNDFSAALVPTSVMLQNLLSGKYFRLYKNDQDLIEDLFLNTGQLVEQCRSNATSIVTVREAYSSIMTNNLNRVIRRLTALTIIFMVPNIVSGYFGMNVGLPYAEAAHAFSGILAFTLGITTILVFILWKNRWL